MVRSSCTCAAALICPALLLALAACSGSPEDTAATPVPSAASADAAGVPAAAMPPDEAGPSAAAKPPVLTLDGLDALALGRPVSAASGWAERGAQASDNCRVVTSPRYPGVYGIVEDGLVRRITVAGTSSVRTVEGVGVGSTRAAVDGAFPGFREAPHHYVQGGVYLTAPGAEKGGPAVRFELDAGGRVTAMHAGMMPVLGYVEGCA